jgi:hypothetical protein
MLARTLRRLRAGWQAITGRFRAGWQDPGQRGDTARYLAAAAVLFWGGLALLIGTRTGLALIAAGVATLGSLICLVGALSALWGRDL